MVKMDDMAFLVLSVVNEIPIGKVASYQQIASLIGYKKNSRLVGHILARASLYGDYPCHRVVNSKGRLVPHWDRQKRVINE